VIQGNGKGIEEAPSVRSYRRCLAAGQGWGPKKMHVSEGKKMKLKVIHQYSYNNHC